MKYKIKDLIQEKESWTCTLLYWQNCECNAQKKKVIIHQVKQPSKLEIINSTSL